MNREHKEPNHFARAAAIFGGAILGGFALFSLFTALDRRDRTSLEKLEEPSAVGDPVVYHPPAPDAAASPALIRDSVPLFGQRDDNHTDGAMKKAGMDDSGKIPLYHQIRHGKPGKAYFVKTGPGRYLELGAAKPKPKPAASQEKTEAPPSPTPEPQTEQPAG